MLEFINNILSRFRPCFSRKAAFNWFMTIKNKRKEEDVWKKKDLEKKRIILF